MSRPRAVLVRVPGPEESAERTASALAELGRLCDTLGLEVVGEVTQRRSGTGSKLLLGEGKLVELAGWTGGTGRVHRGPRKKKGEEDDEDLDDLLGPLEEEEEEPIEALPRTEDEAPTDEEVARSRRRADTVVVDHELTPSQLRNLQQATGVEVLDRTGVILEIFHAHARTREARLQVEIARLAYLAPRLRETGGPSERQAGKGAGESDLELDRRKVRDRIAELRRELAAIEAHAGQRRERRRSARQVALVGYTNAGKSSLMRALTASEPYVADKLFATLDTTVRRLDSPVQPPILVTDTVGFVRDLPHDLVASFRSTLDAALDASLVLHVVDAADVALPEQLQVTADVLASIEADTVPRYLVLNKCDQLDAEAREALRRLYPDAWQTSAHDPDEVDRLKQQIVEWAAEGSVTAEILVPWSRSHLIGAARAETEVLSEAHEDDGVRYVLRGSEAVIERIRKAAGQPSR